MLNKYVQGPSGMAGLNRFLCHGLVEQRGEDVHKLSTGESHTESQLFQLLWSQQG